MQLFSWHSPGGKCSSSWCSTNWESVELYDTKPDISEFGLAGSHHLHQGAKRNGDFRCYQQGSVEWIEKPIAAVSRSSFWDSANFLAICLELPVWTRRELMSSLSLSGDLWGWCSAPGAPQDLTDLDESLSGGQELSTSCFYGLLKAEWDVGRPFWLALWYCLCHSVWWCWLCAGSADYGRLGNQNPDFSYCFKFIWSL